MSKRKFEPEQFLDTSAAENLKCPICLNVCRDVARTRCNHLFCSDCIRDAMSRENRCPVCRSDARPMTTDAATERIIQTLTVFQGERKVSVETAYKESDGETSRVCPACGLQSTQKEIYTHFSECEKAPDYKKPYLTPVLLRSHDGVEIRPCHNGPVLIHSPGIGPYEDLDTENDYATLRTVGGEDVLTVLPLAHEKRCVPSFVTVHLLDGDGVSQITSTAFLGHNTKDARWDSNARKAYMMHNGKKPCSVTVTVSPVDDCHAKLPLIRAVIDEFKKRAVV